MSLGERTKDPDSTELYTVEWVDLLKPGETIVSASFVLSPDDGSLVIAHQNSNATAHSVFLASGKLGKRYTVTSRIVTTSVPARRLDRSFELKIAHR